MTIDRDFTLTTLQELVRIDSRNPGLGEPDAPGELDVARYADSVLSRLGWDSQVLDHGDRRASVLAVRRGSGDGPSLMVNTHLDTVGVAGMADPFSGELRDGCVWGRGAQDIKGGAAAALGLAKALADGDVRLRGDVVIALVADEEHESIGTKAVIGRVRTDAAIVLEPSDLDVSVAHRGLGVFRLQTRGRTAHGGRSDLGIDANRHLARLVAALDPVQERWRRDHRHERLGAGSFHVPLIEGGRSLFIYSDACEARLECRTVPGQTEAGILDEVRAVLSELRGRHDTFEGSVETELWQAAYEIDPDRPIVRTVVAAATGVRGQAPGVIGHPWWEDSALLGAAGIETVIIGPRGGGLHTESEWVDVESVLDLAAILRDSAISFCGKATG